jgi:methionyl-tRNA formyltransferase
VRAARTEVRAVFAGTPEFALPALEALRTRHTLAGVLTRPDRPSGRGRQLTASPVKRAALAHHLPLEQPQTLRGEAPLAMLRAWQPDVVVVVAYGLILPQAILQVPRLGCLNIHASLLPRWRGAAPIQRALLAGDAQTGVSIMQMDAGLDTGAVLLQRSLAITGRDTSGTLHEALADLGAQALLAALAGLAAGTLKPVPQPQQGVTHAAKILKSEGRIDWTRPAAEIDRQVRAFNPWPIAETTLGGESLRILGATADHDAKEPVTGHESAQTGSIVAVRGGNMIVRCGVGELAVSQVQRPGRRAISVADFANTVSLEGRRLG